VKKVFQALPPGNDPGIVLVPSRKPKDRGIVPAVKNKAESFNGTTLKDADF
jgi:hypothetical protein